MVRKLNAPLVNKVKVVDNFYMFTKPLDNKT